MAKGYTTKVHVQSTKWMNTIVGKIFQHALGFARHMIQKSIKPMANITKLYAHI